MRSILAALIFALCSAMPAFADSESEFFACDAALNREDFDAALAHCSLVLQATDLSDKALPAALNMRSIAYYSTGQYDLAIEDLTRAIGLEPQFGRHYFLRGAAYIAIGEPDKAIRDLDQSIDLEPNNAGAYNNRGTAYADKAEYERAVADYEQAIKLRPNFAEAFYNRGRAYHALGDDDQAIKDFDQTLSIRPNNAATQFATTMWRSSWIPRMT
jgi:tetratricopeptide (TPR) repeat protein